MARIETDPNYTTPTFSRATAATDLFKKEDVQQVAAALSTYDHTNGKGVAIPFASSIPSGSITSAMIADGTIVAGDIADGTITSLKIADGTIATADLANAAVTNAKLGTDTARDNLLTNGGFEVWQRGNGPFTTNNVYLADRWHIDFGGGGASTYSASRIASTIGSAGFSLNFTYNHSAGSFISLSQPVEAAQLANKAVTFSLQVKASVAGTVRIWIASTYSSFNTGTTSERLSVTATLATGGIFYVGVDFSSASVTAELNDAMLVVGSVAADYAPLHPADDLARCLRYYEILADGGDSTLVGLGVATAGGQHASSTLMYKTQKPVSPTVTIAGTWSVLNAGQPTIGNSGTRATRILVTSSAAGEFYAMNGGSSYLTVEANP